MGSEISQISYQVEPVCSNFRGRETELAKLEQLFKTRLIKGNKTPVVCVKGVPGVGKTELVKSYSKTFFENNGGHCLWFDKGSYRSMLESVRKLGAHPSLSVPIAGMVDTAGMTTLFQKLTSSKECLIIFDNLNWDEELAGMLGIILRILVERPDPKKLVRVIMSGACSLEDITDSAYTGETLNSLVLLPLTDVDSVNLLQNLVKTVVARNEHADTLIRKTCNRLLHFPWALNQLAVFVNKTHSPTTDKLSILQNHYQNLMADVAGSRGLESPYEEMAYLLWKSFQRNIGKTEERLLRIISYFSPYDITVSDLAQMYRHIYKNDIDLKNAIISLCNFSLIEINDFRIEQLSASALADINDDIGKIKIQNILGHVLRVDAEICENTEYIQNIIVQYNSEEIFRDKSGNKTISLYWMEHTGFLYDYLEKRPELYPDYKDSIFAETVENNRMMMKICSMGIGR